MLITFIRHRAKLTRLDMMGLGSVCDNSWGKQTEQAPSGGGESAEGRHPFGEVEKGGPLDRLSILWTILLIRAGGQIGVDGRMGATKQRMVALWAA